MLDYWKQHYKNHFCSHPKSPLQQVGKTVNGQVVNDYQLQLIASNIKASLLLDKVDCLADLGCGNGVLTSRLSEEAKCVKGFDFTEDLLNYAMEHHSAENIVYHCLDITRVDSKRLKEVDKLFMYEVLQHLSMIDFRQLLGQLERLRKNTPFFIGGIPDKERIRRFYDTDEKYAYYQRCEKQAEPHLGRWWFETELSMVSEEFGWKLLRLNQPKDLYTSHYRFDALLVKK